VDGERIGAGDFNDAEFAESAPHLQFDQCDLDAQIAPSAKVPSTDLWDTKVIEGPLEPRSFKLPGLAPID
jgi:hypothetical protein